VSQTRRLAAILAADVAGYSRLMGAHEEGMLEPSKRCAMTSSTMLAKE
jgi:class 3 adenylate cyclase